MFSLHLIHRTGLRLAAFIQRFIWRTKLWNCLSKVNVLKWRGRHSAGQTTLGWKIWMDHIFVSALWWPSSKFLVSLQDRESQWRRNANYLADIQGWIMHLVIRSGTWALVGNRVYIIVTDGIRQQQSQSSSSAVHSLTPWPAVPKSCRALSAFYDWFMLRGVPSLSNINVTRNVKVLFWLRKTRPHRPLPWSSQTNVFLLHTPIPEQFPARLQTYIL